MIDRLETLHILARDHHLSVTEVYEMTPWMLDIKLLLIQRDLDDKAERLKKQKSALDQIT